MSKTKIVSWEEWVKWVNEQLDGHQRKLERLTLRLELLEEDMTKKVKPMYAKHMEPKVMGLLRNEGRPRTKIYIENRLGYDAWEALKRA